MSLFLDTSVLVPVFLKEQHNHVASMRLFLECRRDIAYCAAHSLLELYSVLTRLPPSYRANPQQAALFLDEVWKRLTPVHLDSEEYRTALSEASTSGIAGGAVYDFVISRCALKVKANQLYTWNLRHYKLFGPDVSRIIENPL